MSLFSQLLPLGLEINDKVVRMVQLAQKGRGLQVVYFKELAIAPAVVQHGSIVDEKSLVEAIRTLVKMRSGKFRLGSQSVIASLPTIQSFYHLLQLDADDSSELPVVLARELSYHIPYEMNTMHFDWDIVQQDEVTLTIAVIAVPRTVVDNYTAVLENAGLKLLALEPEAVTVARLLPGDSVGHDVHLVIFTSDDSVVVFVLQDGVIRFVHQRTFAEIQKLSNGINSLVVETVRYVHENLKLPLIQKIFVAKNITDLHIDETFAGVKIELLNPLQRIRSSSPQELSQLTSDYVLPIGLALREYAFI